MTKQLFWKSILAVALMGTCAYFFSIKMNGDPINIETVFPWLSIHKKLPLAIEIQTAKPESHTQFSLQIDWRDKSDPKLVHLSSTNTTSYLFDTNAGLLLVNTADRTKKLLDSPLENVTLSSSAGLLLDEPSHERVNIFSVNLIGQPKQVTLMRYTPGKDALTVEVELPKEFIPTDTRRIGRYYLLCSKLQKQSILLKLDASKLHIVDDGYDYIRTELQNSGVFGALIGYDEIQPRVKASTYPISYNASTCQAAPNLLPIEMEDSLQQEINDIRPSENRHGNYGIATASWVDNQGKQTLLSAPLLWDASSEIWKVRTEPRGKILAPDKLLARDNYGWSYAINFKERKLYSLDADQDIWQQSIQIPTEFDDIKILPTYNGNALAITFLNHHVSHIYELTPKEPMQELNHQVVENRMKSFHGYHNQAIARLSESEVMVIEGAVPYYHVLNMQTTENDLGFNAIRPEPIKHLNIVKVGNYVVAFGGLNDKCFETSMKQCSALPEKTYLFDIAKHTWLEIVDLQIPYAHGYPLDGGNSNISTSYRRKDYTVVNAAMYFLSANSLAVNNTENDTSYLYQWTLKEGVKKISKTQISRASSTLVELNDGRLAVVGGYSKKEVDSPNCRLCRERHQKEVLIEKRKFDQLASVDDELEGEGFLEPPLLCEMCADDYKFDDNSMAFSSEIFNVNTGEWQHGAFSNYPGGRVVKLKNGRLFKIGLTGYNNSDATYAVEIADKYLSHWEEVQEFPITRPVSISDVFAVGNQVVVLFDSAADYYLVWDDDLKSWRKNKLPNNTIWTLRNQPVGLDQMKDNQLFLLFNRTYQFINWPLN